MKRLSLVALTAAFVLGLAALPASLGGGGTAYAGKRHHDCCNNDCLTRVIVQNVGPADQYRAIFLSNCLKCWYPYND